MAYLRISGSVAALVGAALIGSFSSAGSAPTDAKVKASRVNPAILNGRVQLATPLRKSITALSASELASLRRGIAQMIAWNNEPHGSANFRRSLKYWANMHAYFGSGCRPVGGLSNPGMSGLSAQSKSNPDENATWCTCQHGSTQFLTWHRMYLYYFEKVLQAAAGDSTLRLPYWDYETDGHIPAAYRAETYVNGNGQTVANPLFVANRQADLNNGSQALLASATSVSGAMPATSYTPFNNALEQTPHGAVHCATGVANCGSGYMGAVPAAGNDPIFYSHHANIDRLYECWLKQDPAARLPTGSILTASFSFIDGAGNQVTRVVGDMKTTQQLNYGYTAGGGCPLVLRPIGPIRWLERPWKVFPLLGPVQIRRGVTTLPVRLAPEVRSEMMLRRTNRAPVRQATLALEGVAIDEAPGVMFEVALEDSNGRRVTVGILNFFNETAPHKGDMDMAAHGRKTFDATDALQRLGGPENARLVLVPTTGVTGVSPAAASEKQNLRANVRFARAALELR